MKRILSLLLVSMTLIVFNQSCKKPVEEQKGAINGYVTDKATGDYVENATVLLKPVNKTATTKSDGYFEFVELKLGDYSISASRDGYKDYEDDQTISVKDSDAISRDIEMEKLVSSMKVVDDDGDEISELNFGNLTDDISRTFYILNDGEIPVNYQIEITSSWINIDATEGMLQPDSLERIVVTIDREKLSAGENLATVNVVSGDISVELIVKAYKSINIITLEPSDITTNSAILKGSINIENKSFAERGFILYIDEATSTKYVVSGNDMGEYSHQVMNLGDGQTYRYEAYMICNDETVYGGEITFTTEQIPVPESPIVTTADVTDITQTTAVSGGNVTDDGGAAVTARGVCWSKDPNPTIDNSFISNGNGTGSFTIEISGLTSATTYYIRAYATNSEGTSYGEQKSFTTLQNIELPTVTTTIVTNVTSTTATSGGNVTDDGGATVTARGVCWSTSPDPTIDDNKTSDGNGTGAFTSQLTNLTHSTTYYIRAYATNSEGTSYGEQKYFSTLSDGMINGHQYVDLGLSSGLKWATCNIGADSPEDYGNYYAWGETETKAEYTEDNSVTFGQQLNDISGNAQYDAAAANWGGSWRMPTRDEIRELIYNCSWTPETQNGVDGFKVTGGNGNYIFIPASGYRDGSSSYIYGECYYWSSTPHQYSSDYSYILYSDYEYQSEDMNYRYRGLTIRPVSN